MARNRLLYLAALLGAVVFHMYYPLWLSWFLLLVAAGLPFLSLALSAPLWMTARVRLEGPNRVSLGQTSRLRLRLDAKIPAGRCYVRLISPGAKKSRRISLTGSMDLPLDTGHCTCLSVRMQSIRLLDYLGLFYLPQKPPAPVSVEVWPLPQAPESLPDIAELLSPPLRPKAGGGYAEVHELRDYRPGDPIRDVHWKLSAKADKLIVREAQEEIRQDVILGLTLSGPGPETDSSLGQLLYLSRWLLDQGIAHRVLCSCAGQDMVSDWIDCPEALDRLISQLLHRLPELAPQAEAPTPQPIPGAWAYTIQPPGKEALP